MIRSSRLELRAGKAIARCLGFAVTLIGLATCSCSQEAHAANPSFGGTSPVGAQRGAEVEVVLSGGSLSDAQGLYLYEPGMEVKGWEVVNDNQVKVKLAIAADCRLGAHPWRIRTATGISNLRTFSVGALKETVEAEPNSEFAQPQPAELDTTINGVIETEDVDYFRVKATKGQRITAEVEGIRLGNTFFDPYVAIMDAKRFELANSDDAALVWQDGVASIVAPEDGDYIIQLRESAFGGNGACTYRLHVGTFPRPTAMIPAGGKPGTTLQVRWLGDVAGEWTEEVPLPADLRPIFGVHAHDARGISPSANVFRLGDLDNVLEVEPNNTLPEATPFAAPMALGGVIGEASDSDCFKFAAKQGEVYDVSVFARALRSPLDSVLSITKISGEGVAGNDDNGTPDSYLRVTIPADGEYVIQIRDHLGKGGPDYAYRCELAPVRAKL
ncbi:MAG: PPC domain-containing protein, partial [Planctomycetaceae bacterium]|nr:PPC domain-containing protein [Planctomycetaceae bacterium]